MYAWPAPEWIQRYSYRQRPRAFGCPRDGGKRKHAGCDLYAPAGSAVVAIWHGRVEVVRGFYGGADQVVVDHGVLGTIRYGELLRDEDLEVGTVVGPGTQLGTVATLRGKGLNNVHPMLHLELYSGKAKGELTVSGNAYRRRSDLMDPTSLLDRLRLEAYASMANMT